MQKKKTGRPLSFDHNETLLAAMHVFWAKGYDGASMKDLTSAMGINSPSLYAAFGDKHKLYLQAIKCYASGDACTPLIAFETEPDIVKAVHAFLMAVIDYSTQNKSGAKGCFLASCVSTTADVVEGVDELLQQAIQDTDARLTRRFELEKARGSLSSDFPSTQRAQLLFDIRQGYVFRARSGVNPETMKQDVANRVNMILTPTH
jgi:AcrR family transcriptional regulator